jgi:hypothetical protein
MKENLLQQIAVEYDRHSYLEMFLDAGKKEDFRRMLFVTLTQLFKTNVAVPYFIRKTFFLYNLFLHQISGCVETESRSVELVPSTLEFFLIFTPWHRFHTSHPRFHAPRNLVQK